MKDILNTPEAQSLISVLLTALIAYIKRRFDLKRIRSQHNADIEDLKSSYQMKIDELSNKA